MASIGIKITLGIIQETPQRIKVTDASGKVLGTFDFPTEVRAIVIPSPWWVRARYAGRVTWGRVVAWWGRR